MTRITPFLLIALVGFCLQAVSARAQLSRTFVSAASGNDANNCERLTPCRTFQGAHDKTNPDGEITALDAGGYGALTITKSISIVNDGVGETSILVSGGGTGLTVNGGSASYIHLRGIAIQGIGFGGGTGLRYNSGFLVTLENCVIRNHTGSGLEFFPAATSRLMVSNSSVADNGGHGIIAQPLGGGFAKVALIRVVLSGNSQNGVFMAAPLGGTRAHASVRDSIAAHNLGSGFAASSGITDQAFIVMTSSESSHNGTGILTSGVGANVYVGESVISANDIGMTPQNAFITTFGDNYIVGNDSFFTGSLVKK